MSSSSSGPWLRQSLPGVMLPGCGNVTCDNMEGPSEAALYTQLCSGCRSVRYCSPDCQRTAWIQGGHREVCGASVLD